ncbi:MAG: GntR family transcriptional regulator [bacterium]|nr:GntR family transcriptional regulator [bacterium]
MQLTEVLRNKIRDHTYKPGEMIPSEEKISKLYQVNRATVRKAIAELIKEKLLYAVPATGTFVSEPEKVVSSVSAENKNLTFCWIIKAYGLSVLGPYHMDILTSIQSELSKNNNHLVFQDISKNGEFQYSNHWSGYFLIGELPDDIINKCYASELPCVFIDSKQKNKRPSVISENYEGAKDAVKHLLGLGHRRIAYIHSDIESFVSNERFRGYIDALKEAEIPIDRNITAVGNMQVEGSIKATEKILKDASDITAIFAVNDETAIGALKVLSSKGLSVPKDVSIIGFDDIGWAKHSIPPLTTVRISRPEIAFYSVRLMMDMIERETVCTPTISMPTELIVRESTAPAKTGLPKEGDQ